MEATFEFLSLSSININNYARLLKFEKNKIIKCLDTKFRE